MNDISVVDIDVILQNGMETTTPSAPVHPQVNANLLISNSGTDTRVAQNLSNNLDKESSLVHSQQPNVTTFQDNTLVHSDHIRRYILGDFITFHFSLSKSETCYSISLSA
ncbi:unnamed protein product, partial [Brassica rapa subsp. narinosa]